MDRYRLPKVSRPVQCRKHETSSLLSPFYLLLPVSSSFSLAFSLSVSLGSSRSSRYYYRTASSPLFPFLHLLFVFFFLFFLVVVVLLLLLFFLVTFSYRPVQRSSRYSNLLRLLLRHLLYVSFFLLLLFFDFVRSKHSSHFELTFERS